jgi:hypothetical protein
MVLNYISNIGNDLLIKCPSPVVTKKWALVNQEICKVQ